MFWDTTVQLSKQTILPDKNESAMKQAVQCKVFAKSWRVTDLYCYGSTNSIYTYKYTKRIEKKKSINNRWWTVLKVTIHKSNQLLYKETCLSDITKSPYKGKHISYLENIFCYVSQTNTVVSYNGVFSVLVLLSWCDLPQFSIFWWSDRQRQNFFLLKD